MPHSYGQFEGRSRGRFAVQGFVLHRVPRNPWWLGVVGMLFVLPTLGAGIVFDDVLVRMRRVANHPAWGEARWWDLYTFADPALNEGLRSVGFHPWWADPQVQMTFFRPLSSATHVLDYALWPDAPWLHHAHSVLWYGAAVVAVAALLRRLDPE